MKKVLCLSGLLGTSLLIAPPLYASDLFGAIAYSLTEKVNGSSYNYDSRDEAEAEALNSCVEELSSYETECSVELWFKNGYGALAEGVNGFGTGYGTYKQEAQLMALENCHQYTSDCDITLTIGTD